MGDQGPRWSRVEIPLRDARPGPRASPTHPLTRMPGLVVHILERTLVRERQRECIELAKSPSPQDRRPSLTPDPSRRRAPRAGTKVPKTELARQLRIHRDTVYR